MKEERDTTRDQEKVARTAALLGEKLRPGRRGELVAALGGPALASRDEELRFLAEAFLHIRRGREAIGLLREEEVVSWTASCPIPLLNPAPLAHFRRYVVLRWHLHRGDWTHDPPSGPCKS